MQVLLGFCAGSLGLGLPLPGDARLPLLAALGGAALALVLGAMRPWRRSDRSGGWPLAAGLALGLMWSGTAHHLALAARLKPGPAQALALVVRIDTSPRVTEGPGDAPDATRFQVRVLNGPDTALRGRRLRLTWYDAPVLARGEVWSLAAEVKGPWSYANPGGFDYERWLLGQGIHGTGWTRRGERLETSPADPVERLRQELTAAVESAGLRHAAVLLALLLGRADGIDDALWEVLRATGTVHLMVISGLHVSLATTLGFLAGRLGCRLCPWALLWLDARHWGCLGGAVTGAGYVVLAGAGVPAMRALATGLTVLLLLFDGRRGRAGAALLVALTAVLLMQPLAVHQQGFWLSFGAVTVLLLALGQRHGGMGWPLRLLGVQFALSVGMLPLVALFTGSWPWTGIPANLLAVPVVSVLVVPPLLLGGLLVWLAPPAAVWFLTIADTALGIILAWLHWLAGAPAPLTTTAAWLLVMAQGGSLWLLLGAPRRYVPVVLLCCSLAVLPRGSNLSQGEYRVTALDVGQGTAVVVDTRRHRLLYDAGPGFPGGFDTGSAVVVPSLLATGAARVDTLILSHDDTDHVGGAGSVVASLAPSERLTGGRVGPFEAACHGRSWRWDGVSFRVLELARPPGASDNDGSCVLVVDDGRQRTLLAGDVSVDVEAALLRRLAGRGAQLMFAPHHGSRTSSSRALVRVLEPRIVFVSAGFANRFGHPHPEVVRRYREVGARLFQTGRDGALIWRSSEPDRVLRWRSSRTPYWRAGAGGD